MLLNNADDFIAQWAPKVGDEAARLRWRGSMLLSRSYLLNFVWIPLVIAGGKIPLTPVLVVGVLVGVVAGLLIVFGGLKLRAVEQLRHYVLSVVGVERVQDGSDCHIRLQLELVITLERGRTSLFGSNLVRDHDDPA